MKTPKMETIRRDVRRQRAVLAAYPPITDDTLLQIPNAYDLTTTKKKKKKKKKTGEQFLQYDNGRHDRILIFGSTESLNIGSWTGHSPQFRSSLYNFTQFRTCIAEERKKCCGAYDLLPNKRIETYIELLTQIQILTNQVNTDSVLIDFEQSVISAMDAIYSIVPQKCLLFHLLCQNVYRRVQQEGLSHLYLNDDAFRTSIRMTDAINFVPIAVIKLSWIILNQITLESYVVI